MKRDKHNLNMPSATNNTNRGILRGGCFLAQDCPPPTISYLSARTEVCFGFFWKGFMPSLNENQLDNVAEHHELKCLWWQHMHASLPAPAPAPTPEQVFLNFRGVLPYLAAHGMDSWAPITGTFKATSYPVKTEHKIISNGAKLYCWFQRYEVALRTVRPLFLLAL